MIPYAYSTTSCCSIAHFARRYAKLVVSAEGCGNLEDCGPMQLAQQTGTHPALLHRNLTQTETVPAEMQTSESRALLPPSVNVKQRMQLKQFARSSVGHRLAFVMEHLTRCVKVAKLSMYLGHTGCFLTACSIITPNPKP